MVRKSTLIEISEDIHSQLNI